MVFSHSSHEYKNLIWLKIQWFFVLISFKWLLEHLCLSLSLSVCLCLLDGISHLHKTLFHFPYLQCGNQWDFIWLGGMLCNWYNLCLIYLYKFRNELLKIQSIELLIMHKFPDTIHKFTSAVFSCWWSSGRAGCWIEREKNWMKIKTMVIIISSRSGFFITISSFNTCYDTNITIQV